MICKHKRGGHIAEMDYWLCADCLNKLASRPIKYGAMVQGDTFINGEPRQGVIWRAEIAKADDTLFSDFLRTMTRRIMQRTRPAMGKEAAYDAAIEMLKAILPDTFGDMAYGWDHGCARELVDMEMDNWDEVGAGN